VKNSMGMGSTESIPFVFWISFRESQSSILLLFYANQADIMFDVESTDS